MRDNSTYQYLRGHILIRDCMSNNAPRNGQFGDKKITRDLSGGKYHAILF